VSARVNQGHAAVPDGSVRRISSLRSARSGPADSVPALANLRTGSAARRVDPNPPAVAWQVDALGRRSGLLPRQRGVIRRSPRRAVLVRTDAAGATHAFTHHLAVLGVEFSVGAYLHYFDIHTVVNQLPEQAWTPAYQVRTPRAGQHGTVIEPREGAWVAEATGLVDLTAWPARNRLILRRERPHPGAQLRITDVNGHRIVGMRTNIAGT